MYIHIHTYIDALNDDNTGFAENSVLATYHSSYPLPDRLEYLVRHTYSLTHSLTYYLSY